MYKLIQTGNIILPVFCDKHLKINGEIVKYLDVSYQWGIKNLIEHCHCLIRQTVTIENITKCIKLQHWLKNTISHNTRSKFANFFNTAIFLFTQESILTVT